jgi:hypothetical protein
MCRCIIIFMHLENPKRNIIWDMRSRRKAHFTPPWLYVWRPYQFIVNDYFHMEKHLWFVQFFFFFANATWIFSWYLFFFKRNVDLLMVRVRKYETNDRKHPQIIHRGVHVLIREHNLTPAVIWGVRLSRWGGRQCYQNGNCRRGHTLF